MHLRKIAPLFSCRMTEMEVGRHGRADTKTGQVLLAPGPGPSRPQQYADPSASRPHACARPRLIAVSVRPGTAGTGFRLPVVSPVPNCPAAFDPQQETPPSRRTPHDASPPALRALNLSVSASRAGMIEELPFFPVPTWPDAFSPQQYTSPSDVSAQLCAEPVVTVVNVARRESRIRNGT